jgi:hypothetical protein
MKKFLGATLLAAFCTLLLAASPDGKVPKPQYDEKGNLIRPADYRDWMFLSSGYGMNYSPAPGSHDMFTNVFVPRWPTRNFSTPANGRSKRCGSWKIAEPRAKAPSTSTANFKPTGWAWPSR